MLTTRKVEVSDFETVRELFEQGRSFQQSLGFVQWLPGYPSEDILVQDMERGRGYVFMTDDVIVGYASIFTDSDEEYDRMAHIWRTPKEYGAVHRLVLSDAVRGRGLGRGILEICEDLIARSGCKAVRIDTGLQNKPMQRLLAGAGYSCRGEHNFVWGPRLAYEKLV